MADELKPCPFCGGEASWGYDFVYVYCVKCNSSAPSPEEKPGVPDIWNARAADLQGDDFQRPELTGKEPASGLPDACPKVENAQAFQEGSHGGHSTGGRLGCPENKQRDELLREAERL